MTDVLTEVKIVLSVAGGFITSVLGGCDTLLAVLLGFIVVDYLSGVAVALKQGKLSSRVGFLGILKKAMILSVVFVAHLLDVATGFDAIRSMTVMFYISNEGISLVENMARLDVKIPRKIRNILEQLEDENEDTEDTQSDN